MPRLIRLLISVGLIVGVMSQFGDAVIERLWGLDRRWLLLALLLTVVQVVLSAWRWRYTAHRLGLTLARGSALSEYYLATLVNQVLPGGVVGDAQRAWRHGGQFSQRRPAFQAVVIERLSGQVAMAALAVAAWLIAPWPTPMDWSGSLLVSSALAAAALLGAGYALQRYASTWWQALQQAFLHPHALPVQLLASLLVALSIVGVYACCLMAISPSGSPGLWFALIPVVLFSMLIPVSIAGWGLREGTAALLWPLAGLPAAEGVTAAIVYGSLSLIASLPGVIAVMRR